MSQRSTIFFSRALAAGVWLAVIVTPFIVFPWVLFPFLFAKTLVFQALVALALIPFVVLCVGSDEWRRRASAAVRSKVGLAIIFFAFASLLATLFGIDRDVSWWGTEERGGGTFTLLHIVTLFFMLKTVYPAPQMARALMRVVVIAGVLLSAIALLRLKGVLLFGVDSGYRFSGTIGNPIFFGILLLFEITFALYLAATTASRRMKLVWGTIALLQTVVLFLTQTRGAVVGLLIGCVLYIVLEYIVATQKTRRGALVCILGGVVIVALIFAARDTSVVKRIHIVHRLTHTSLGETTTQTRLIAWKIALNAWREKPIFGWGPENFSIAFNRHYNPRLLEYSYGETWFDKPHNVVLEMLATRGAFGALTYLAIYGAYVFSLRNELRSQRGARILVGGAMSYLGAGLTAFDTPTSLIFFMLLLMLGGTLPATDARHHAVRSHLAPVVAGVITAAGIVFFIWRYTIIPMQASNALLHTLIVAADRSVEESMPIFSTAFSYPTPYKEEARNDFAKLAIRLIEAGKISKEALPAFVEIVGNEYEKNVREHSHHAYYPFLMGRLYAEASRYDLAYRGRAEAYFAQALALSPRRQQFLFAVGKLKFDHGDLAGARMVYEEAMRLAPRVGEAHWFLAIVLRAVGDHTAAEQEFIEAARWLYPTNSRDESLLLYYATKNIGEWGIASTYLERALSFEESAALYAELALVYRELGQWENVKKAAHNATRVDPSYEREAEAFITSLPE